MRKLLRNDLGILKEDIGSFCGSSCDMFGRLLCYSYAMIKTVLVNYEFVMNSLTNSYEIIMEVLSNSYEILRKFLANYSEILTKFLRNSY